MVKVSPRSTRRRRALGTSLLVLPMLLAACGGGDSPLGPDNGGGGGGGGGPTPASVVVTPGTQSVAVGATTQLTATVRDGNGNVMTGQAVTWSSANSGIAQVSGNGMVTGVAAGGPVQITATAGGRSGTAAITVTADPCTTTRTISLGQTTGGTLGPGDCQLNDGSYFELWTFTLTETRSIAIDLTTGVQFDAYLLLTDADGNLLLRDDDTGEGLDARIVTTLPAGTYRIYVNTFASGDGGSYNLKLSETNDPCAVAEPINVGQSRSGSLASTDCRLLGNQNADIWRLTVGSQQSVRIAMDSPGFDTYLILVNASGGVVAEDDDDGVGTNARIDVTLPAGTYYIYATSYLPDQVGFYNLAVSAL